MHLTRTLLCMLHGLLCLQLRLQLLQHQ
jgi:hypothetical protein